MRCALVLLLMIWAATAVSAAPPVRLRIQVAPSPAAEKVTEYHIYQRDGDGSQIPFTYRPVGTIIAPATVLTRKWDKTGTFIFVYRPYSVAGGESSQDSPPSNPVTIGTTAALALASASPSDALAAPVAAIIPDPAWRAAAVFDCDGDGVPDCIYQHETGVVGIWCIHAEGKVWIPANNGSPMKEWAVVGAGDFNSDGLPDLILQHSDGRIGAWCMDAAYALKEWKEWSR
jgi:hypothetical protein